MCVESVTLCRGGEKFIVNPFHIGAIRPSEDSPKTKTVISLYGKEYKIRGSFELIKTALGWKDGPVVGFGDLPESAECSLKRTPPIPEKQGPQIPEEKSARRMPAELEPLENL